MAQILDSSQTGIERGSNSLGSWVKFPDGTMICMTVESASTVTNTALGSIYNSGTLWFTWPQEFIDTPYHTSASVRYGGAGRAWAGLLEISSRYTGGMRIYGANNTSSGIASMMAIGRWK